MEQQRSQEWFKKRLGRVTGSVAGAILGLNPWRTADDVMRSMVRAYHGAESEFTGNVATEYGTFHEPGAIVEYVMETGNKVQECGFFAHENGWLGASPDGLVDEDGLVEIKCPYGNRNKKGYLKTLKEQPYYYAQVQIEIYCAKRKWCDFYQWAPVGTSLERVPMDNAWLDCNLPILHDFYKRFLSELDNTEHLQPLRAKIDAPIQLIEKYDELTKTIEEATEDKKAVLAKLVALAGEKNADFDGRKLTLVQRAPSVSYSKACKKLLKGVDLSEFTGKASEYWRLS